MKTPTNIHIDPLILTDHILLVALRGIVIAVILSSSEPTPIEVAESWLINVMGLVVKPCFLRDEKLKDVNETKISEFPQNNHDIVFLLFKQIFSAHICQLWKAPDTCMCRRNALEMVLCHFGTCQAAFAVALPPSQAAPALHFEKECLHTERRDVQSTNALPNSIQINIEGLLPMPPTPRSSEGRRKRGEMGRYSDQK